MRSLPFALKITLGSNELLLAHTSAKIVIHSRDPSCKPTLTFFYSYSLPSSPTSAQLPFLLACPSFQEPSHGRYKYGVRGLLFTRTPLSPNTPPSELSTTTQPRRVVLDSNNPLLDSPLPPEKSLFGSIPQQKLKMANSGMEQWKTSMKDRPTALPLLPFATRGSETQTPSPLSTVSRFRLPRSYLWTSNCTVKTTG